MFTININAEQRVQKAVVAIMNNPKYVALSGVLMLGERAVKDDVPTACTNGRDEYYGRDFVNSLTDPELRFLILHETYHKLYKHLITWKHLHDKDAQLANKACDYVINCKITDDNHDGFAKMPECGLLDDKYRGWDAARVFKALEEEQDGQDAQGEQGQGQGRDGTDSGDSASDTRSLDSHEWDAAASLDAEEQRQLERELDEAIRQGAMAAGKTGGTVDRELADLMQPQVDWREVLRDFISSTCNGHDYSSWARPNRRYMGSDVYMPSTYSEQVDELVLAIDTSASISQYELTSFLSEVSAICEHVKPSQVRVLYWGHIVAGDEVYTDDMLDTLVQSTKPIGGGGTDVDCVCKYIKDQSISAQAVIVLTDGDLYNGWGTWDIPVLWCIQNNPRKTPSNGQVVHITL